MTIHRLWEKSSVYFCLIKLGKVWDGVVASFSKNYLLVQNEGGREVARNTKFYNLDIILAIGYRVRSNVGIQFRNWTSKILKEYMQKGFVMNYERLKNPKKFGDDYFDELLERMRLNINPYKYSVLLSSIRASIFEALESFGPLLAPYDPIRQQYPK